MDEDEKAGSKNFFLLQSYRDLYFKCRYDWKQLSNSDPSKKSYAVFNLITTLNHMFDWVVRDEDVSEGKRLLCITLFNPYKAAKSVGADFKELYEKLPELPTTNTEQYLVRSLCNKAKHLLHAPSTESVENTIYFGAGHPEMYCGGPKARVGYHEIIITHTVEDGGNVHDVKVVCETLMNDWQDFFRKEGLFFPDVERTEDEAGPVPPTGARR